MLKRRPRRSVDDTVLLHVYGGGMSKNINVLVDARGHRAPM